MIKQPTHRQKIIGNIKLTHNTYYTQKIEGKIFGITLDRYRTTRTIDFYLGNTVQSFSIRKTNQ